MNKTYTIDAAGRRMGIVASETAALLLGKQTTSFAKNVVADVTVRVENVSKLDIPEGKRSGIVYSRYSGYPGGFKKEKLGERMIKKGSAFAFKKIVRGMLPKNKLIDVRMKRLIVEN